MNPSIVVFYIDSGAIIHLRWSCYNHCDDYAKYDDSDDDPDKDQDDGVIDDGHPGRAAEQGGGKPGHHQ